MSLVSILNYDNISNFTPSDAAKVGISGAVGTLLLVDLPGLGFSEDFASSVGVPPPGFVYDDTKIEFSAGLIRMRQKDQTPTNAIFGGTFPASKFDLDWASGSVTHTKNGTPTNASGRIDCLNGTHGVYWAYTTSTIETYKVMYTPDYTGAPGSNINVIASYNGSNNNDRVVLTHSPSADTWRMTLNNSTGGTVISTATTIGATGVGLTSGVAIELELVIDSVAGTVRIFNDGVLYGTLSPGAWTRGVAASRFYVGASPVVYDTADGSFDDLILFDNAQHTAGYTPGYTVPTAAYAEAVATLPTFTYSGTGDIQEFTNFTTTEFNDPKYIINDVYWDGAAWVASSDTYATATSKADLLANIATHPVNDTVIVKVVFQGGSTQSYIDQLDITYSGQEYPQDNPSLLSNTSFGMTELVALVFSETKTGSDEIKYTAFHGGQDYYISGGALAPSNGTYAESSTSAEWLALLALGNIDINPDSEVFIRAFFHSDDGSSTPTLTSLTLSYNFFKAQLDTEKCAIYGYVSDGCNVVDGATIKVTSSEPFYTDDTLFSINECVTSKASGYYIVTVPETTTAGVNLDVEIKYTDSKGKSQISSFQILVPAQNSVAMEDIVQEAASARVKIPDRKHQEDLALIQKIRNDPWEFSKYVFTKDEADKQNPKKRFPYQLAYIKLYFRVLQKENRVIAPKSRRMRMTWANVVFFLWDTMFNMGRHNAVVSKKEDDADWLIKERFLYIYENLDPKLPKHLLPKAEHKQGFLTFPEIESKLQGFPQGEHQLRMYTLSNIFADEMAFWEEAEGTYSASMPTLEGGGRFVGISSPGPGFFKDLVLDRLDDGGTVGEVDHESIKKRYLMEGVEVWKNKKNEFLVFQLHYTADPEKRSKSFKEGAKKGISLKRFNQEYELQWDTYQGQPVYTDFNKRYHGAKTRLYPHLGLPILRGWDFGLTPACILAQMQGEQLVVFKEFVAFNMGIDRFSDIVMAECSKLYPSWNDQSKDFMDFIDPSGTFRKDTDEVTCAQIMARKGIKPIPGPITWEERRSSVEYFLQKALKGDPCFQIDMASCPMLVKGFEGGYRYPDKTMDLEPTKIRPLKDEHSHAQDGLQMITGRIRMINRRTKRKIPRQSYSFIK